MAQRVSFDHNYYFMECEEETNAGVQARAVASTSTMEASGAMAVAQAGAACRSYASRGTIGYSAVYEPNAKGDPKQESESDTDESYDDEDDDEDDGDEDDLSTSDQDSSDPEQEEAALFVAAAAPPIAPAAAAIQIPGPHRSRRRRRHRRHRRGSPYLFTQWQIEEMESLFGVTPYPDVLTRYVARTRSSPNLRGL